MKGKNIRQCSRSDFGDFVKVESRWNDLDALGHINNAVYLTYLESARIHLAKKWNFKEPPFIMAALKIDYYKQITFPSAIYIGQKISRLGTKSFDIMSGMFAREDIDPSAAAVTTLVCFDYQTQTAIPVPDIIIEEYNRTV